MALSGAVLPLLLSNGHGAAECHGFVMHRKKEKHLPGWQVLQFFYAVLFFGDDSADAVCQISGLQLLRHITEKCELSALYGASVDAQGHRCFSDGEPLRKTLLEHLAMVGKDGFHQLLHEGEILTHGGKGLLIKITNVLTSFLHQLISPEVHPVVDTEIFGVLEVAAAAANCAGRIFVILVGKRLSLRTVKSCFKQLQNGIAINFFTAAAGVFIDGLAFNLNLFTERHLGNGVVIALAG